MSEQAVFQVGLKAALWNEGRILLLRDRETQKVDFPGGRIDRGEEEVSLEEVLLREVKEEIGENVRVRIGPPVLAFREFGSGRDMYQFYVLFEARYLGGDIVLSDEHDWWAWTDPASWDVREEEIKGVRPALLKEKAALLRSYIVGGPRA